jgi:hypothetical protein
MNENELELSRNCPKCNKIIICSSKKYKKMADKLGSVCYSCAFSGRPRSEEYRNKIRQSLIGRKLTEEHKQNIKNACQNVTDEMRQKMSIAGKGRPSHRKGTKLTKEWKRKIRNTLFNLPLEIKQKIVNGNKLRKISDDTRLKMRLSRIKYIEKVKFHGAQMIPSFNFNACQYLDKLSNEMECNFQHALNGGEYYIKSLGYWVDGYDKKKNIVVEYDEGQHNRQKENDTRRMNEIKQYLGCRFFRYDSIGEELKEY